MLKHLVLLFLICFTGTILGTEKQQKPNIILILADDLGYGDLSCYGSVRQETPNLDKMADEGIRFSQFYAGSAVCTPTRVSILTGKYPLRFNVSKHFNDQEMFLQENIPTIPHLLKEAGYTSKHVGKWHLGGLNEKHIKDRKNSMPGPMEHGFDHYLAMLEDPLYRKPAMLQRYLYERGGDYLVRDEKRIEPIKGHWTDIKTDESLDFIEKSTKTGKPFFLNLWYDVPHAPYEAAPDVSLNPYKGKAKGDDLLYRSMVRHLDHSVGRVLEKLKELGIAENTLVIFTSDNGPAYRGSPGPFKGRKVDFHEGGIRVPAIAWWPGHIQKGQTAEGLFHTTDLLPTFCSLAGLKSQDLETDGRNILPYLLDTNVDIERGYVFWQIAVYKNNGNYGITVDKRPEPVATEVVRKGNWKLLTKEGVPVELFNLEDDPYERWDLKKQYPEITEELTKAVNDWLQEPRMAKPY